MLPPTLRPLGDEEIFTFDEPVEAFSMPGDDLRFLNAVTASALRDLAAAERREFRERLLRTLRDVPASPLGAGIDALGTAIGVPRKTGEPTPLYRDRVVDTFKDAFRRVEEPRQIAERLRRLALDERRGRNYRVEAPGLEEIIKLRRPATYTREEYLEHRRRLRQGEPTNLTPAQLRTLRKNARIARRIRDSPTPRLVRAVGELMGYFDDIQDALVTTSFTGRVVQRALQSRAPRAAAKFVPALRVITTAADMLNMLQIINALFPSRGGRKKGATAILKRGLRTALRRVVPIERISQYLPTLAETVQILQTTESILGIGLALGPIVGYLTDVVSLQTRRFVRVISNALETSGPAPGPSTPTQDTIDAWDRLTPNQQAGLTTLGALPFVAQTTDLLDLDDMAENAVALNLAAQQTAGPQVANFIDTFAPEISEAPLPARLPRAKELDFFAGEGIGIPATQGLWPLGAGEPEITPREAIPSLTLEITGAWGDRIAQDPGADESILTEETLTDSLVNLFNTYEGGSPGQEIIPGPEALAAITLLENNQVPTLPIDRELAVNLLDNMALLTAARRRKTLSPAQVAALGRLLSPPR